MQILITVNWWRGFGFLCVVLSAAAFAVFTDKSLAAYMFGMGVFACAVAAILSALKPLA